MAVKKIIQACIPQRLIRFYQHLRFSRGSAEKHDNFIKWWKSYTKTTALPPELRSMVDHYITTVSFKASSKYWNWLNHKNIQQLAESDYGNFKQTIAKNYFTWIGGSDALESHYVRNILTDVAAMRSVVAARELMKKHALFTLPESVVYNIITVLLYEHVKYNAGGERLIGLVQESPAGNPPVVEIEGNRVSQDTLNSILEYLSITKGCDLGKMTRAIEIGAGYGRTAYCVLKANPSIKYVIADIPPALYVSQTYLASVFKDKKIFRFRPFRSFAEIADEFFAADIVFLMPEQLDLLPDKVAGLFLAISCLHEMKKEQVQLYFDRMDRLSSCVYFKCWQQTTVPFDDVVHTSDNYPVKRNWTKTYKHDCTVPAAFFEAMYEII